MNSRNQFRDLIKIKLRDNDKIYGILNILAILGIAIQKKHDEFCDTIKIKLVHTTKMYCLSNP